MHLGKYIPKIFGWVTRNLFIHLNVTDTKGIEVYSGVIQGQKAKGGVSAGEWRLKPWRKKKLPGQRMQHSNQARNDSNDKSLFLWADGLIPRSDYRWSYLQNNATLNSRSRLTAR